MTLRQVTPADAAFLYNLLAERPLEANISHRSMPTMDEHRQFIASQPYAAWYVIQAYCGKPIGQTYITRYHEIGIQIAKPHQGKGHARGAIRELMRLHPQHRFLANIAPTNQPSQALFASIGFTHIQNTMELRT